MKDQVLIVPVSYIKFDDGFTGNFTIKTKDSYMLYDSIGVYKPLRDIEKKICFIRISVLNLIKDQDNRYLVKELTDKTQRPCIELGLNSYVKSYSGNYKALYNQLRHISSIHFNQKLDYSFIGNIRDLTNKNVKSILGCIYYSEVDSSTFIEENNKMYEYKWYTVKELIDVYNKATSWSKIIIDLLVDDSIKDYI